MVTAGTGIGALSFGPLANVIMAAYGWKIGMLVFAAIMLTGVLFGAIMRPLEPQKVPIIKEIEMESVLTFIIMTHLTICFFSRSPMQKTKTIDDSPPPSYMNVTETNEVSENQSTSIENDLFSFSSFNSLAIITT